MMGGGNVVRIHLPLTSGGTVNVGVTPSKRYGKYLGETLIERYGKRPRKIKNKSQSITILKQDFILNLPTGELPPLIKIGDNVYKAREFLELIEKALGIRIISKRDNRALKHIQNTSIRLPIKLNEYCYQPLEVIGKDQTYLLK